MGAIAIMQPLVWTDRRGEQRLSVSCEARLITLGGDRVGRLCDLSTAGARMEMHPLPTQGATALLKWLSHERLCTVVWVKDGKCGLRFDKPLSLDVVGECVEHRGAVQGPQLSRIAAGRKRSSPLGPEPTFRWSVTLATRGRNPLIDPAQMNTAEQMFFLGAPLAHVLAYETRRKGLPCC